MAIVEEVTKQTSPLEKATEKRKEGNELFANSNYKEAIEKYMVSSEGAEDCLLLLRKRFRCVQKMTPTRRSRWSGRMSARHI